MVDQYRTTPLFYVDNTRRIAFVFSISDRNERTRIQSITDQPLKVFEVVSKFPVLWYCIKPPVCIRDIVKRLVRPFLTSDNLIWSIDRNWGFQEQLSDHTVSFWIVMAGNNAGESICDRPQNKRFFTPVSQNIFRNRWNNRAKMEVFIQWRNYVPLEMGYFIEIDLFLEIHLGKSNSIPIFFSKELLQEKRGEWVVLGIRFLEIFLT